MDDDPAQGDENILQAQLILLAASHHNLESLQALLRTGSASVQDPETGFTPLHAAIAACAPTSPLHNGSFLDQSLSHSPTNSDAGGRQHSTTEPSVEAAVKTLKLLLQNGAIWNDIDHNNETPGCLALRLGLSELYSIMVDAGVRAEILLNRLDEYEQLADTEIEDQEVDSATDGEVTIKNDLSATATGAVSSEAESEESSEDASMYISKPSDAEPQNDEYLQSTLRFQDGRILDGSGNAVMMAWESGIMEQTTDLLVPVPELRVLNIGHGMGIIDVFFQRKLPSTHHIVEAHPAVLARMKNDGWYDRPNITIHEGRWQDVVPKINEQGTLFDAIYFDTFAEDYKAFREFFNDCVIGLLDDGGKWGFFNGLGADRQICYDVYGKVVEMDLFEAGFDTEWKTVDVSETEPGEWKGVGRKYWTLKEYKLPVCEFIG